MSLIIDGKTYAINVVSIERAGDFLDRYARRTVDGVLHRRLIGVYFNYKLKLGRTYNVAEYSRLWDKLTEPVEYHTVTVPDSDGSITFTAYFAGITDKLVRDKGGSQKYWKELTVNFIARSPSRVPS